MRRRIIIGLAAGLARRVLISLAVVTAVTAVAASVTAAPAPAAASVAPAAQTWQPPQVVRIQGGEKWTVLSPLYITSFHTSAEGGAVLVRDGELMFCEPLKATLPYLRSDGLSIKAAGEDSRVTVNGKTVSLVADDAGLAWLEKASAEDLAALRYANISMGTAAVPQPLLEKLARANPRLGLEVKGEDVARVLGLFRPRWLVIGENPLDDKGRKALAAAGPMDLLAVTGNKDVDISFLADMKGVRTLFLGEGAGKSGPIPGPRGLASLIVLSDMKDLAPIARLAELEELALIGCNELADIRGLKEHEGLKTLVMTGCEKVTDLAPLKDLKELRWLGLPQGTTQAQLEQVVRDHPDLVVLELVNCEKITDLTPLKGLAKLESVIIATSAKDLAPLHGMKQLKLIGLAAQKDAGDKVKPAFAPEQVENLKKALPSAAVVTITPICLGSGWILLLAAAVAAGYLIMHSRSRRAAAARA